MTRSRDARAPLQIWGRSFDELLALAAVVVAGLPLRATYDDASFAWTLFLVPVGVFVAALVAARWLPSLVAFVVGLAASLPLVVLTTKVDVGGIPGAIGGTIPRLLTVVLPWHSDPEIAAGLAFTVAVAAAATGSLAAVQTRRAVVMAPPVALLVLSIALASSTPERAMGATVALSSIIAVFLALGRPVTLTAAPRRAGRRSSRVGSPGADAPGARPRPACAGWVLGAVSVLAVAVAVAVPLSGAIAGDDRTELRRDPSVDPDAVLTPLAIYKKLKSERPDSPVVAAALPTDVERIRLAVLDEYDGVSWGSRSDFVDTGGRLGTPGGSAVTQVETFELPGRFVPVPPSAAEIDPISVRFSEDDGVVITGDGQVVGSRTYRVSYDPAVPDGNDLIVASLGDVTKGPAAAALAGIDLGDDGFAALAKRVTSSAVGPYMKLDAIKQYIDSELGVTIGDEPVVQGTSFAVLHQQLSMEGGTVMSLEQYVTLFAWLADAADIPVRLAVGFALDEQTSVGRGAEGQEAQGAGERTRATRIRGEAAHVWPEVHFEGLGWVPYEVTQDAAPTAAQQQAEDLLAAEDEPSTSPPRTDATGLPEPGPDATTEADSGGRIPLVPIAVVALVVVAAAWAPTWKALRRRRRRALPAVASTEAAWAELVQRLADVDIDLDPGVTADHAHDQIQVLAPRAAPSMSVVALTVQEVVYAEKDPPTDVVEATWHAVDATLSEVRIASSLPKRLVAPFRWRGLKGRGSR